MTPESSSRRTRSVTLGADSPTARARSAMVLRASAASARKSPASIPSIPPFSIRRRFIPFLHRFPGNKRDHTRLRPFKTVVLPGECWHVLRRLHPDPDGGGRSAPSLVRGQRDIPLSRAVLRRAAVSLARLARRRLASHRLGG